MLMNAWDKKDPTKDGETNHQNKRKLLEKKERKVRNLRKREKNDRIDFIEIVRFQILNEIIIKSF